MSDLGTEVDIAAKVNAHLSKSAKQELVEVVSQSFVEGNLPFHGCLFPA